MVPAAWPAPRRVRSYTFRLLDAGICPPASSPSPSPRIGRALPSTETQRSPRPIDGAPRSLAPEAGVSGSVRRSLSIIRHPRRQPPRLQSPSGKFRGKRLIRSEESGIQPGRWCAAARFVYEGRLRSTLKYRWEYFQCHETCFLKGIWNVLYSLQAYCIHLVVLCCKQASLPSILQMVAASHSGFHPPVAMQRDAF